MLWTDAAALSDRVAILADEKRFTYAELLAASQRVAAALLDGASDLAEQRIAFLVPPGFEYAAIQWGIWQAGGIAVPLGVMHPPAELDYVLADSSASAVVVDPVFRDRVASTCEKLSIRLLEVPTILASDAPAPLPEVAASRRAMILYTSGTTSRPKGVVTTHANILAQIEALREAWEWTADDRILHVLPLHHIHGIINVLSCALRSGACCEFLAPPDADAVLDRFAAGELTLFMAVPTIYSRLIAAYEQSSPQRQAEVTAGCRKMRVMVSGSAALPVSTLERWREISGHTLLERYGMTEIGMALSNPLHGERVPGHVGKPLPGVEVRRVDESGKPLASDETPGEIEIRGPAVFLEYWGKPEITASSFHAGWFRTGDVAVVEDGVYRLLGRTSIDIIKTGGYKVSALEIEEVLRTHPDIRECAVVGIADPEWGERVAACLVLEDSAGGLDIETLRTWGKERLAAYKVPTLLTLVDDLPRNAMGKVQKPAVKELFAAPEQ